ncbi:MAG: glutamate racemase [Pseudomonadota bacterium]
MIGVFDSGIGGLSILKALRAEMPREDFVYFADTAHAPYGERGDEFVAARTRAVVEQLRREHAVKALVVACNTATAAAIHLVRAEHPDLPLVGVEPALKPAVALTRTRRIGVLATRGTLASEKFKRLHASVASEAEFVLQPCNGLADAIEKQDVERIEALCRSYAAAAGPWGDREGEADVMVLGCTHYPFVYDTLAAIAGPGVRLIETGEPVARQTRRMLAATGSRADAGSGIIRLQSSGSTAQLQEAFDRWF